MPSNASRSDWPRSLEGEREKEKKKKKKRRKETKEERENMKKRNALRKTLREKNVELMSFYIVVDQKQQQ